MPSTAWLPGREPPTSVWWTRLTPNPTSSPCQKQGWATRKSGKWPDPSWGSLSSRVSPDLSVGAGKAVGKLWMAEFIATRGSGRVRAVGRHAGRCIEDRDREILAFAGLDRVGGPLDRRPDLDADRLQAAPNDAEGDRVRSCHDTRRLP